MFKWFMNTELGRSLRGLPNSISVDSLYDMIGDIAKSNDERQAMQGTALKSMIDHQDTTDYMERRTLKFFYNSLDYPNKVQFIFALNDVGVNKLKTWVNHYFDTGELTRY